MEIDLTTCHGSATAVKLMDAIRGQSGMFRVLCRNEAQAELVDRAASRARERQINSGYRRHVGD